MYEDPNQPDTEKRLLLALLLSTAVLLISPYVLREFFPSAPEPVPQTATTQVETAPAPVPELQVTEQQLAGSPAEEASEEAGNIVLLTQAEPRLIRVQNRNVEAVWSNRGVVLESLQLLNYVSDEQEPLQLIPQNLDPAEARPFALGLGEESLNEELAQAVFEVDSPGGGIVRAPVELNFRYQSDRLEVRRRIVIPEEGYVFEVETDVRVNGRSLPYTVYLGPGIGDEEGAEPGGFFSPQAQGDFAVPGIAYSYMGSVERWGSGDVEEPQTLELAAAWVAYDSRFFSYLLLAPENIQSIRLDQIESEGLGEGDEVPPATVAQVGFGPASSYLVFAGPKDLTILRGVDASLADLVDYGWLAVLVKPLLFCLKVAYGLVGNYGWAIILVTFFINLILLPIRYKQTKSMKKMSEVQPQLKAIQARYKKLPKGDPKRQDQNKEVMELYQKHGVNPLGGCLPLLVQMPFLFAFYRMLASSIELRGAPFMLWIQDLSKADPYYITPIVMGVTMIVQQKMTPTTGDPAQKRMMMIMPVMFMFFFLTLSSGLVIYFLFSNLFGMLLQWGMQKMSEEEPVKVPSHPRGESKKGKRSKAGK